MPLTRTLMATSFLVYLLSSCKKEDSPETGDKQLQQIVTKTGDSMSVTTFHYDTLSRVMEITGSNSQSEVSQTIVEYNTKGDPVKFTTIYLNSVSAGKIDSLVYENDRITKKLFKYINYSPGYKVGSTYTYDAKGRLVTDSTGFGPGSNDVYRYTTFAYDDNDNIIEIKEYMRSSDSMKLNRRLTASYNSEKNPYSNTGALLYFSTDEAYFMLSKHNRTQVVYEGHYSTPMTENYAYDYDGGLLNRMVLNRSLGGPFGITTINFYYQ